MSLLAESRALAIAAAVLWIGLAVPPARALFESTMTLHMLVQLPLLGLAGVAFGLAWRHIQHRHGDASRALSALQCWNLGGATGVILAGFVMVLWMLPRGLDMARLDLAVDVVKFVTVTVAGVAIALSWFQLHAIARGVIHLEVIATLFRFGWGYMATDERLCLAYLSGDQQRAGELLLCLGAAYALAIIWRPLFGPARHPAPAAPPPR